MFLPLLKSFYSPNLYCDVSDEKGIGFLHLFSFSLLLWCLFTAFDYYAAIVLEGETSFANFLLENYKIVFIPFFKNHARDYPILVFLLFTVTGAFGITLPLLICAFILSILGFVINLAIRSRLSYSEVLRVTVYAEVPAFVIALILTNIILIFKNSLNIFSVEGILYAIPITFQNLFSPH